MFRLFEKKEPPLAYDREHQTPVIRSSICTGEKTAGFLDERTGRFTEVVLIRSREDLESFCRRTGTDPDRIRTIY